MPRKNEGLTAEGQKRPQKADISKNGSINLEELRKRDKGKVSLRIDANTGDPCFPGKQKRRICGKISQ